MKYFLRFNQFVELPNGLKTEDEILNAYLYTMNGPQGILDYFIKHIKIFKDNIKDTEIIEEINSSENNN